MSDKKLKIPPVYMEKDPEQRLANIQQGLCSNHAYCIGINCYECILNEAHLEEFKEWLNT